MDRSIWLIRRLSSISPAEAWWRARQSLRTARRRFQFKKPLPPLQSARILCPDLLAAGLRLPAPGEEWPLPVPDGSAPTEAGWASLQDGQWEVFGRTIRIEPPEAIPWRQDPFSGDRWEHRFAPVLLHSGPKSAGEPRSVWELNRLAFCYWLAAPNAPWELGWGLQRLDRILTSWSDANPTYWGINWTSAMEAAIRALHICWSLLAAARQDRPAAKRLADSWWPLLCAHAGFVIDRLSLHSSANNHLILELVSLLAIHGLADLPDGDRNKRAHRFEIELMRQLGRQFDANGINREHSSGYHRFVMQALELLKASGLVGNPGLREKLADVVSKGGRFLHALSEPGGQFFLFGDFDDGNLFTGWPQQGGSPCLNHVPGTFSASGYLLADSVDWDVFLDVADDGLPPLYGHAHSTLLGMQARFRGSLLLGDPGTHTYLSNPSLRRALRGRAAHCVFGPAGWEPMLFQGPFLVRPSGRGQRISASGWEGGWFWLWGRHDCHPDYFLERAILCCDDFGCLVLDRAQGKKGLPTQKPLSWASRLTFAPGWEVTPLESGWKVENSAQSLDLTVRFSAPEPWQAKLQRRPYSTAFQRLTETPTLIAAIVSDSEVRLLTHLAPGADAPVRITWSDDSCRIDAAGKSCRLDTSARMPIAASCRSHANSEANVV
ncbi:MAG: heparinase II/III family protein, partial [Acidobacteriota bacterium]